MAQDDMDTEALLRDLEQRAQNGGGGGAKPAPSGGDEDIEAFLRELEGSDYEPPPEQAQPKPTVTATKTRRSDPVADELGAPQEAPDAPLAKPEKKVSARQQRKEEKRRAKEAEKEAAKKAKTDVQVVERGESKRFGAFVRVAKWSVIVVPTLVAIWLLGAFLSSWVSASWLVAAVATALVLLLPLAARLASKRGKYGWWAAGLSALIVAALVAPMPASAGRALERYGHWPATVVADLAGWSADHVAVRASAAVGSFVGQLIHPTPTTQKEVARKLGTEQPLDAPAPVGEPVPVPPAPVEPAPVEPAPAEPAPPGPAPGSP